MKWADLLEITQQNENTTTDEKHSTDLPTTRANYFPDHERLITETVQARARQKHVPPNPLEHEAMIER